MKIKTTDDLFHREPFFTNFIGGKSSSGLKSYNTTLDWLGKCPLVSSFTGTFRALAGVVHTIKSLAKAVFCTILINYLSRHFTAEASEDDGLIKKVSALAWSGAITGILSVMNRRKNHQLEQAKEGAYHTCRGLVEVVPFLGNLAVYYHDKNRPTN